MRKTLTLNVDDEMADFIESQKGMGDPNALMMQLFHQDMQKQGFQASASTKQALHDEVIKELELSVDRELPSAG